MDLRRILIAFALSAVISTALTVLLAKKLRPSSSGPAVIQVVAASKQLAAGVPLTAQDLTTISWPSNIPLNGSVNKTEDVIGHPLRVSVDAMQPILDRDLAAAGSGFGLAARIPAGMRATAVRSNEIVGVAGFLFPGSRVDVLATYALSNGPLAGLLGGGSQTSTQTVLQNVEVLTAGTATEPDPQGRPQTVNVVTLLLTPEDSQKLLLASSQGSIQFVLRSGVDRDKLTIPPTRISQLTDASNAPLAEQLMNAVTRAPRAQAPAPAPAPAPVVQAPPAPKAPEPYVVEVIQGTQRSTQKFAGPGQ